MFNVHAHATVELTKKKKEKKNNISSRINSEMENEKKLKENERIETLEEFYLFRKFRRKKGKKQWKKEWTDSYNVRRSVDHTSNSLKLETAHSTIKIK